MIDIVNIQELKIITETEYSDIIECVVIVEINQIRIYLKEGSFIDVWYSLKLKARYSYHWERRMINKGIYRCDNAPHKKWENVSSFPKHFHFMSEENVIESNIPDIPQQAIRYFLDFVKEIIYKECREK